MSSIAVTSCSSDVPKEISDAVEDRFDFLSRLKTLSAVCCNEQNPSDSEQVWNNSSDSKKRLSELLSSWFNKELQLVEVDTSHICFKSITVANQLKPDYSYCNQNYLTTFEVSSMFGLACHKEARDIFDQLSLIIYGDLDRADHIFFTGVIRLLFEKNYASEILDKWIVSVPDNLKMVMILHHALSYFGLSLYLYEHLNAGPSLSYVNGTESAANERWMFVGMFAQSLYIYYAHKSQHTLNPFPIETTNKLSIMNLGINSVPGPSESSIFQNLFFQGRLQLIQNEMKEKDVWHHKIDDSRVTVFEHRMNLVVSVSVSPQEMKSPISFANKNYCVLHQFGAIKLTMDVAKFRSFIPIVKTGYDEMRILFKQQHLVPVNNTPFYNVYLTRACYMTLEDAYASNFQNLKCNPELKGQFHSFIEPSTIHDTTKTFDYTNDFGYLFYEGEDPGIYRNSKITDNWKVDPKNDLDGIQNIKYELAVGDSFTKIQCGENHLLKVNTLFSGTKVWFVIPTRHHMDFEKWANDSCCKEDTQSSHVDTSSIYVCPEKIPSQFEVTFAVQQRGDTMIFDCGAIHLGFNIGFSVSATTVFPLSYWKYIYNYQLFCNKSKFLSKNDNSNIRESEIVKAEALFYLLSKYPSVGIDLAPLRKEVKANSFDDGFVVDSCLISKPIDWRRNES